MKINYNLSAQLANTQLLKNEKAQAASAERLSSGYKINHAKDDPAGIAIANRINLQIKGLKTASKNSSDAISAIQIAESSLGETQSIIQRMRELSVQAANDSNTLEDREAIQAEIDSLTEEVDRISGNTEFNKKILLDGSLSRRTYTNNNNVKITSVTNGVAADDYGIKITADARQAVYAGSAGDNTLLDAGKITAEAAGYVEINGVRVQIEEGDDGVAIYEKIRDGAETACVTCIVTEATAVPVPSGVNESIAGYQPTSDTYDFSQKLVFISDEYGSKEHMNIKCSNPELAKILGIYSDMYAGKSDTKYATITGEEGDISVFPEKLHYGDPTKVSAAMAGNITVSTSGGALASISIDNGDTAQDVYDKIQAACNGIAVEFSMGTADSNGNITSITGTYDFTQPLSFKNTSLNEALTVSCDNARLSKALGLMQTDVIVSGIDVEAEIPVDALTGKPLGYENSATLTTDGKKITVRDLNGFQMEMVVNRKVCDTVYDDLGPDNVNGKKCAELTSTNDTELIAEITDMGTMTAHVGANANQVIEIDIPEVTAETLGIDNLNVRSYYGSQKALDSLDKALSRISDVRAKLGAYQNRLEHTITSLDASVEDVTAAVSRIKDVDMADEMTTYTAASVLAQAATSVLSQANDIPQQALQLLN